MVQEGMTLQADLIPGAFFYTGESSTLGGGCGMIMIQGPPNLRDVLAGGGWILMLLALSFLRGRRSQVRVPVPAEAAS